MPLTDSLLSSRPDDFLAALLLRNFFLFHYERYGTFLLGVKRLPSAFSCFDRLLFPQPQLCFPWRLPLLWTCFASVASRLLVLGLLLRRSQLGGAGGALRPALPRSRCQPQLAPTCHGESSRGNARGAFLSKAPILWLPLLVFHLRR